MKKLILCLVLGMASSSFARAESVKVVTGDANILSQLDGMTRARAAGNLSLDGTDYDLMALALTGYKVVKITYSKFAGGCTAALTFNKADINSKDIMMFHNVGRLDKKTPFDYMCNGLTEQR